jgi:hypothetical protein
VREAAEPRSGLERLGREQMTAEAKRTVEVAVALSGDPALVIAEARLCDPDEASADG